MILNLYFSVGINTNLRSVALNIKVLAKSDRFLLSSDHLNQILKCCNSNFHSFYLVAGLETPFSPSVLLSAPNKSLNHSDLLLLLS